MRLSYYRRWCDRHRCPYAILPNKLKCEIEGPTPEAAGSTDPIAPDGYRACDGDVLKIALFQLRPVAADPALAIERLRRAAGEAGRARADVLVAPELLLPGYNVPEAHGALAQAMDGPWVSELRSIARRARCAIVFGWAERDSARVYNAATAIGPDGAILGHYRKRQLFGGMERDSFAPGDAMPKVFDLAGRRTGLLICYDVEFPEHARDLARRGAELILVPTANPAGYEHVQRLLVPARACENGIFVAYANYCGSENGLDFGGGSLVAGPDGAALGSAGEDEALLFVELPRLDSYPAAQRSTQLTDLVSDGSPAAPRRGS